MNLDGRGSLLNRPDKDISHFEDTPSDFVINIGGSKYTVSTNSKVQECRSNVQSNGHQELPENLVLSDLAILP
jgi:hypothetical protein